MKELLVSSVRTNLSYLFKARLYNKIIVSFAHEHDMSQSIIMVKIAFQFSLFNAAEGTSLISILPHPSLFPRSTQTTTFQLLILAQNIFSGQRVNLHLSITNSSTSKKISSSIRNYSKWVLIRLPGVSCACSVVQEQKRKCAKGKRKSREGS